MAKLPIVAIIGRPNTGKSTLFNRIAGKRRAIVNEMPGTTRDHVVQRIEGENVEYLLLDTGGIGGGSEDHDFEDDVAEQSLVALGAADLILFTVNGKEEITASDYQVADLLRKRKRRHVPVILVLTKCDNFTDADERMHQYYELGVAEDVLPVSAVHRIGTDELEEKIEGKLKEMHFGKKDTTCHGEPVEPSRGVVLRRAQDDTALPPRISVAGRPNVGKSSVINALMSEPERGLNARLVSDIPGTTRDSSDSIIRSDGKEYIFVDTAGLRRKSHVDESLETISALKSIQAMEDSDIVILLLDAKDVISKQDKRIASLAIEAGKGLILVLNKADLLTPAERREKEAETRASLSFCRFCPLLFVSALTKDGLLKIFPLIDTVYENRLRRIPTGELRRWYETAIAHVPAHELSKSKYVTQADGLPPTFVVFIRNPKKVAVSQLRALENNLRSVFSFEGVPLRWVTKVG